MPVIDVDFATYKSIVALRQSEAMTEGDVIREAVSLLTVNRTKAEPVDVTPHEEPQVWWHKGVHLPVGLELAHSFRDGRIAQAKIVMGGIEYCGERFGSLSAAGVRAAGHQVDGWAFWNFLNDRGEWLPMKAKRQAA